MSSCAAVGFEARVSEKRSMYNDQQLIVNCDRDSGGVSALRQLLADPSPHAITVLASRPFLRALLLRSEPENPGLLSMPRATSDASLSACACDCLPLLRCI